MGWGPGSRKGVAHTFGRCLIWNDKSKERKTSTVTKMIQLYTKTVEGKSKIFYLLRDKQRFYLLNDSKGKTRDFNCEMVEKEKQEILAVGW